MAVMSLQSVVIVLTLLAISANCVDGFIRGIINYFRETATGVVQDTIWATIKPILYGCLIGAGVLFGLVTFPLLFIYCYIKCYTKKASFVASRLRNVAPKLRNLAPKLSNVAPKLSNVASKLRS